MTKAEYIDFIRNSLPQVDKTSKYHHEQVAAAINVAVNTIFYDMYKQQPKSFKKSMERYTSLTSLSVILTGISKPRYNSAITVDVVDLPRKTGGIIEIVAKAGAGFPITTTTTRFVPVSTMEGEQFYGAECSLPDTIIGFSYSGVAAGSAGQTNIEFWNMDAATAVGGVYARLIRQFMSYGLTENVILPYGRDQQIIELVRQFLGAIPPKDLLNDNADGRN